MIRKQWLYYVNQTRRPVYTESGLHASTSIMDNPIESELARSTFRVLLMQIACALNMQEYRV